MSPEPRYACLYRPPASGGIKTFTAESAGDYAPRLSEASEVSARGGGAPREIENVAPSLDAIAQEFSPRYERHGDDLVSIDVCGLERLLGTPRAVAHELRREAADRGVRVQVAIAGTRIAAIVLALARPGITVVDPGNEAAVLAAIPIGILEQAPAASTRWGWGPSASKEKMAGGERELHIVSVLKAWGLRTLGELAALPSADLAARLGQQALAWQAVARGEDVHPLAPTLPDERFESSLELDWPIEGLEPLSFVLTRLLEPLSIRLERRDRGAAVLHVQLRLVTKAVHGRSLELPAPLRDVRTLRTLALVDLESHPPPAAIDRVTITIDPTPGRVLQHTLFTRAYPTPDAIATLLARLGALMGQERIGAPSTVDTYRPGAFAMAPFGTLFNARGAPPPRAKDLALERRLSRSAVADCSIPGEDLRHPVLDTREHSACGSSERGRASEVSGGGAPRALKNGASASARGGGAPREIRNDALVSALRRYRQPIPARVVAIEDRPVRLTTDRRGFAGGSVVACAGPWRTSGNWWSGSPVRAEAPARRLRAWSASHAEARGDFERAEAGGPGASEEKLADYTSWDRDEWDVALSDGAIYRVYQDRETNGWFIDGIVD